MSSTARCPSCGAPVSPEDFQCGRCELLLNVDAEDLEPVTEPSVVRALLSIPENTPRRGIPVAPLPSVWDDEVTVPIPAPIEDGMVPRLVGGIDLALKPLHPFEAYLTSFLDGRTTVKQMAAAASLGEVEVRAVLRTLSDRGWVELASPPPPFRARPVEPPVAGTPSRGSPTVPAGGTPSRGLPTVPAPGLTPSRGNATVGFTPSKGLQVLPAGARRAPPTQAERAVEQTHPAGILQQAVELERSGNVDGAIQTLKQGIAGLRNPAPLYNRLALILVNQRKDYAEAEDLLRRALTMDPNNTVYEQNLVKVLTRAAVDTGPAKKKGLLSKLTGRK